MIGGGRKHFQRFSSPAPIRTWRPYLTECGCVAFTEPVWLRSDPDAEIERWWSREYPAITDAAGVLRTILDAGYRVIESFVLPAEASSDDYFGQMEVKISGFLVEYERDEIALEIAAAAEMEISMFRRFSDTCGYAFFVAIPEF